MKPACPPRNPGWWLASATLGAGLLASAAAFAQELPAPPAPVPAAALPPGWRIAPGIGLVETWSDNVALAPDEIAKRGLISDLTPSLRIERYGARLRVFADARLHILRYSNESRLDETTRFLDSVATFEPVEKRVFIEGRAIITQQNRSPFGAAVAPDAPSPNANRVETRAYQIAPYARGPLGGLADYQVRYNATVLSDEDSLLPRTRTGDLIGRVRNSTTSARLGWAVDARDLRIRNDALGDQNDSRMSASLLFGLDPQLQLSINGGRESTDFNGGGHESNDTYGAGFAWTPTPRTLAAAVYERRFFGDAHDVTLSHRTASTAWRLASRRDATNFATQLLAGNSGTVQALMADLLIATVPDPVQRQAEARRRLEETGAPTGATFSNGFVSERPYVLRSDEASAAYVGPRDTLTVAVLRTDRRALGATFTAGDSPLLPSRDDVRERTASASWVHRLTPLTSLTLVAATRRTDGINTAEESRQQLYSLLFTSRLGRRTYAAIGFRHTQFESTTLADYRENAVVASLSYRP